MSDNNVVRLDLQTLFTAATAPNLYAAFLPVLQEAFPGRDFDAQPASFVEVAIHVQAPAVKNWTHIIDLSSSEEEITQEKVRTILTSYSPNCVFYEKKFFFRNEEDLTHCKMAYM
jgi:hypothetical protein